jgi:hypothetical protein
MAATGDVIDRMGKFNPEWTSHAAEGHLLKETIKRQVAIVTIHEAAPRCP